MLRPERPRQVGGTEAADVTFSGEVVETVYLGETVKYRVQLDPGFEVVVRCHSATPAKLSRLATASRWAGIATTFTWFPGREPHDRPVGVAPGGRFLLAPAPLDRPAARDSIARDALPAGLLFAPMALLLAESFEGGAFEHYAKALTTDCMWGALDTLVVAACVSLMCLLLGYPLRISWRARLRRGLASE